MVAQSKEPEQDVYMGELGDGRSELDQRRRGSMLGASQPQQGEKGFPLRWLSRWVRAQVG